MNFNGTKTHAKLVGIDGNPNFNCDSFKGQAIDKLYTGKGFNGKNGVLGSMMNNVLAK
jgi:hypothetical protein